MEKLSTQEKFSNQFLNEEKEILVLIETKTGGAFKVETKNWEELKKTKRL